MHISIYAYIHIHIYIHICGVQHMHSHMEMLEFFLRLAEAASETHSMSCGSVPGAPRAAHSSFKGQGHTVDLC